MAPGCPRVIQITDRSILGDSELMARVERAGTSGHARHYAVQLRDPELDGSELWRLAKQLRRATAAVGAWLIVNDRLDIALAVGADGVHLGRSSVSIDDARRLVGPDAWLSVSAHRAAEAEQMGCKGVSAVLLSPIFASPGKGPPLGLEALSAARKTLPGSVALVALGGITAPLAARCFAAGAAAVAAIRADLTAALDPTAGTGTKGE